MSFYENLPVGTYLRDSQGHFIRVISMQNTMAYCERVKRDGSRDLRTRGWSGSLSIEKWHLAELNERRTTRRGLAMCTKMGEQYGREEG